jgi:hypothetical protein
MNSKVMVSGLLVTYCAAIQAQDSQPLAADTAMDRSPISAAWQLNLDASEFPGQSINLPQRPLDDGEFQIGLPFDADAEEDPGFVFVPSAVPPRETWQPPRRMPRMPTQDLTYEYTAQFRSDEGTFVVNVRRRLSRDGRILTLAADLTQPHGGVDAYVLVFDKQ